MNYDDPTIASNYIAYKFMRFLLFILTMIIFLLILNILSKSSKFKINHNNIDNIIDITNIIKITIGFIFSIAITIILYNNDDKKLFVFLIIPLASYIVFILKKININLNPMIYIAIEVSLNFITFLYLFNAKNNYTIAGEIFILAAAIRIISLAFKALLTLKQFNANLNPKIYNAIEYSLYFILFLYLINEKGLL